MGISLKASISSLRRVAATGLLGTGLIAAFSGAAEATPNPRPVPPHAGHRGVEAAVKPRPATPVSAKLRPPAGNVPIGTFSAKGVQIYECTGGTWESVEPVATLFGPGDRPVAVHFRGPSWQSIRDGSLVEGKAIANVEVKGTIPLLLLEATKNRGDGLFGRVTYIQRLATSGGAAPTRACKDGEIKSVPYRAQYRFFAAKNR